VPSLEEGAQNEGFRRRRNRGARQAAGSLLVAGGHHVVATTRTPEKLQSLRAQDVEAIVVDGLDRNAVLNAVLSARPDVIVHQMTALASMRSLKRFDDEFASTNRLRTEGTEYLLAAARAAGTQKIVVQSYTGWPNERQGVRVKTEDDPLEMNPPKTMKRTLDAIRELESKVLTADGITGIVLRYGSFYGPGTSLSNGGEIVELVRHRKFPVIGGGSGIWSFIHIDDAVAATQLAIERGASGIYNVVDDDPAEVSDWLPELARAIAAKPPYRVPAWIGRLAVGEAGVSMMTQTRGSSNAKAKRALGWRPIFASWRDGFRRGLSDESHRR
jgi:nucleoside-diphosphate-sugar epimerase